MKIGVLGAGISGLSIAKILSEHFFVEVLEKKSIHGGIARTKTVENYSYHVTGGHCFNSKYPEVLDFVFNKVLPKKKWHRVLRNASIKFEGNEISYPIEFAVKEIFNFNPQLAISITKDFLNANDNGDYVNLEDWFRKKFGNTLAEKYFLPYNKKIWNRSPNEMNPQWVDGKLPIPNVMSFFEGLVSSSDDSMPHSVFYYPDTNNQNTFIDSLAAGTNIKYNVDITSISFNSRTNKWLINNSFEYDLIINTLPLNELPHKIDNCPHEILETAALLKYNKVTTMLWETAGTDKTWTYVPGDESIFHRYIHIGSFFSPKSNVSITESVGEKTYDEMVSCGQEDPFLKQPLDYHVSKHAYVVFDENYSKATKDIMNFLTQLGIYTIGRFGEWQYYNMDVCIMRSIETSNEIISKFKNGR